MKNPRYSLTLEQAKQLFNLWHVIDDEIDEERNFSIYQQLRREKPELTKRQVFFICITLAQSKADVFLPEWLIALRESTHATPNQK